MELKFVNSSYFWQLFQNLRPKLQNSKNRIFVTSHFGTLLNTDIVPIKSLYFEPGAKRKDPGRKYSGLYGKSSVIKWPYVITFWHHSLKIVNTCLFCAALSLHVVRI